MAEFAAIGDAVILGKKNESGRAAYSFRSFEAFRKGMTPKRSALLKLIRGKKL